MAVGGTIAAPVAVKSAADGIYASARVGIWHVDQIDTSDFEVRSFSSRFGVRGETELGNGLSAYGRYEWDVDFNDEETISLRHRYVGLRGDFGSVTLGQDYHTFYNFVVGPVDSPWWHSGYGMINYRGRTDNAVTYFGGSGAVSYGTSLYFTDDADEEDIDEVELGFSVNLGDTTLAVAYQHTETTQGAFPPTDEDIVGITWSDIAIGSTTLAVNYMNQGNIDSFVADWWIGHAYVHVENLDFDTVGWDILYLTLGYTQTLGRKTTMYYEINETKNGDVFSEFDRTTVMAILKYNII